MEALLKVLDRLIQECSEAKAVIVKMVSEYDKAFKKVADREAELKKLGENLDKREEAIGDQERILEIEKSNKAELKEISAQKDALTEDRISFDRFVLDKKKEISQEIKKLEDGNVQLKKEWEILKKAQESLNKEKEEYKERIAKGIVNAADRK
jgi:chromosome segregation ATPase